MEPNFFQLPVCVGDVTLRVAKGHFATRHSHINYCIDVTAQKASLTEATAVAQQLAERYLAGTPIDAILCLDGTRVIGACLGRQLTRTDSPSVNAGHESYILRAERDGCDRILFRDNAGGQVAGIAAIYSSLREMEGVPVSALFDLSDLPDYASHDPEQCPLCRRGVPLDAEVNSFGYATI